MAAQGSLSVQMGRSGWYGKAAELNIACTRRCMGAGGMLLRCVRIFFRGGWG